MKALLLSLLLPVCAFARLGETRAEITKRYGEPIHEDKAIQGAAYRYGVYRVVVIFIDGKSEAEFYSRWDESAPMELLPKLQQINGGDAHRWNPDANDANVWRRSDGTVQLLLSHDKKVMSVVTSKYLTVLHSLIQRGMEKF